MSAAVDRGKLKKKIENELKKQLKANGINADYLKDMISDYMSLWDLKNELLDDIKANGIKVVGMHGPKSNPAINDLHKTNDRMIKILDALNLNAPKVEITTSGKTSKSDLV